MGWWLLRLTVKILVIYDLQLISFHYGLLLELNNFTTCDVKHWKYLRLSAKYSLVVVDWINLFPFFFFFNP